MICAAEADFLSCMHLSNCMTEQSNCTLKTCGSFAISTSSNQVHEDQMLVTQVFNRENKHRKTHHQKIFCSDTCKLLEHQEILMRKLRC